MNFEGWKDVKLGEILLLNYGKGLPVKNRIEGSVPVYSSAGLTGWHNEALINKSGIIIGRKGTVGAVHFSEEPFYCIDTAYYLTEDDTKEDLQYLYYLLHHLPLEKMNTDSAVPGLNRGNAYSVKISLPPIQEQKAIANILSTLDEKIEVNNQINETLENMAQELFKRWFVDFEFPDKNGEPYKSSGGEMVESELGLIPKGWEVKFLESISKIKSGKRPPIKQEKRSKEANYPIAGASKIMGYTNDYNFDSDILVIGRVGTHGIIQRFNDQVWASDNTLVITSEIYEFVYQILRTIDYNSLNRGSTQPLITQKDIKKQKTVVPKMEILQDFEKIISGFFKLVKNNKEKNNHLTKIRDTLLPKIMSGELRVPLEDTEEVTARMKGG